MAQVFGWPCDLTTIAPLDTESFEVCEISADQTALVNTCYNTTSASRLGTHFFSCSGQFDGEPTDGFCPGSIQAETQGFCCTQPNRQACPTETETETGQNHPCIDANNVCCPGSSKGYCQSGEQCESGDCVSSASTNPFSGTTSTPSSTSTTDGAVIATSSVNEASPTLLTSQPTTTSFPASISSTAISSSSINTSPRSGLTTGAKAGIAIGAIIGSLAILALLFLCFRFCFARRRSDDSDFKMVSSGAAPGSSGPPGGPAPYYTGYDDPLSEHPMNEMRDIPHVSPPYPQGPNYGPAGLVGGAYGREPGRNNTIARKPVGAIYSVQERSEEGSRPVSIMSEERPRSVAISDIDE